jgi:hypothetical protein
MASDLAEELERNIPLSEMIQTLRQELLVAVASRDDRLHLRLDSVELELQVVVTRRAGSEAGIKFSVVSAGAKREKGMDMTHTFKLNLAVTDAAGKSLRISSNDLAGPLK